MIEYILLFLRAIFLGNVPKRLRSDSRSAGKTRSTSGAHKDGDWIIEKHDGVLSMHRPAASPKNEDPVCASEIGDALGGLDVGPEEQERLVKTIKTKSDLAVAVSYHTSKKLEKEEAERFQYAVQETFRQFKFPPSEIEYLTGVIKTQDDLERLRAPLLAKHEERLKADVLKCAQLWCPSNGSQADGTNLLLLCQAVAGPNLLHPAFKELEEEAVLCRQNFTGILLWHVVPRRYNKPLSLHVRGDGTITLRETMGCPVDVYQFNPLVAKTDCEFWHGLARLIVKRLLSRNNRLSSNHFFSEEPSDWADLAAHLAQRLEELKEKDDATPSAATPLLSRESDQTPNASTKGD